MKMYKVIEPIFLDHRLPLRFWKHVILNKGGCWLWIGARSSKGYGRFALFAEEGVQQAHRITYEALIGPIPVHLQPDHKCRVTSCVNPLHIQLITRKENILLGTSFSAINARKTECLRGHPLKDAYITSQGWRQCRKCVSLTSKERDLERKKSAGLSALLNPALGGAIKKKKIDFRFFRIRL